MHYSLPFSLTLRTHYLFTLSFPFYNALSISPLSRFTILFLSLLSLSRSITLFPSSPSLAHRTPYTKSALILHHSPMLAHVLSLSHSPTLYTISPCCSLTFPAHQALHLPNRPSLSLLLDAYLSPFSLALPPSQRTKSHDYLLSLSLARYVAD